MAAFNYLYSIDAGPVKVLEFDAPATSIMTILRIINNEEFGNGSRIVESWSSKQGHGGIITQYGHRHTILVEARKG